MYAHCPKCQSEVERLMDEDPILGFEVEYFACSNTACELSDVVEYDNYMALEDTDSLYDFVSDNQYFYA